MSWATKKKKLAMGGWAYIGMYLDCLKSALWNSSFTLSPVGKTSLITRFMYDSFDNTYQVSVWLCACIIMHVGFDQSVHAWCYIVASCAVWDLVYELLLCMSVLLAHYWNWLLFKNCVLGRQDGKHACTHTHSVPTLGYHWDRLPLQDNVLGR